jgi:ribonuclease Z
MAIVLSLAGVTALAVGLYNAHPWLDVPLRTVAERKLRETHAFLSDRGAMNVFVCGSSSPIATEQRAKTCIGVVANGEILLFDVGAGSLRNIEGWGLGAQNVSRVFLTHFHSDHIADLDEANVQGWIWGRDRPLLVHGPVGVNTIVDGYNDALSLDYGYRNSYGTERYLPRDAATMIAQPAAPDGAQPLEVYRNKELLVEAFLVDHAPVEPALGYRIRYGDRVVVISGDTRRSPALERFARGADLVFHEAQSARLSSLMAEAGARAADDRMAYVMSKAGDYHTSSESFADIARTTGAAQVVMYHLAPPPDNWLMRRVFLRNMPANVSLAHDGLLYRLVPGETDLKEDQME